MASYNKTDTQSKYSSQVIVVGASLSGLQVAHDLQQAGVSCIVLEARNRVGGSFNNVFRSAQYRRVWIDPSQHPRTWNLVNDLGLEMVQETPGKSIMHGFKEHDQYDTLSMDETETQLVMRMKRPQDFREALAQSLSSGSILFSKSACSVDRTCGFKCVLTTTDGHTFECSRVIIAVPSANKHIDFTPVLGEPRQWMQDREPSQFCVKTVLIYDQSWWRMKGLSGHSQSMQGPIWETYDTSNDEDGVYALTCIIACESGSELWGKDLIERREAILAHLRDVFSTFTAIPDPILRIEPKDTSRIRRPLEIIGLEELVEVGSQGVNGRIHFTGSEADDMFKSHLEEILSCGSRAAGEVLTAMAPNEELILAKL
ncbi:hypothetical protein LB507_004463 [Fusarium sp. FIESC RH6]|nr:hypothetical protein LB507_004463 [Fusarium sp. FIESC RH6]